MIYFCLMVIGACTAVLFMVYGYTIDVQYGTAYIKGLNPEFRIRRKQGRLFVQAWHSDGTFWRKENPTPADMNYVGLNPSDMLIQRSPSQEEEDAFAERLRLIGAQDWEDQEACEREYYNEECGQRKFHQSIYGWPSNGKGLWVYEYNTLPHLRPRELLDALRDIRNMDEQCAILEKWQATFYEDPGEYPPLADVFKDQKIGECEKKEQWL